MRIPPFLFLSFLFITPASSQIIYSGLLNITIPLDFEGVYVDVDTGNTGAFEMPGWDINFFFGGVGVAGSANFQPGRSGTGNEDPIQRIDPGTVITEPPAVMAARAAEPENDPPPAAEPSLGNHAGDGPSSDEDPFSFLTAKSRSGGGGDQSLDGDEVSLMALQFGTGPTGSFTHLGAPGNFQDGEEGYLGFRFMDNDGGGPYYGWMRVTLTANTPGAVIHDWAWESNGGSIIAGQVPEPGFAAPVLGVALTSPAPPPAAAPDPPVSHAAALMIIIQLSAISMTILRFISSKGGCLRVLVYGAFALLLTGPLAGQTGSTHPQGYATLNYVSGYSLLNTQFGDNDLSDMSSITVTTLLANTLWNLNPGTVVQRWTGTEYTSLIYRADDVWVDPTGMAVGDVALRVGEGLVVYNPGPARSLTTFGYIYGGSGEDEIVNTPIPQSPPGIYLRGGIFPVGPNSFEDIMGRPPVEGDAVMKLTAAGAPLISRFTSTGWVDSQGRRLAPFLNEGESAFFDTTGSQFLNFPLPNAAAIPEPAPAVMVMAALMMGWFATGGRHRRARPRPARL